LKKKPAGDKAHNEHHEKKPHGEKKEATPKPVETTTGNDECDDLFGDESEADKEALEVMKKKKEDEAAAKHVVVAKPGVIAKSLVILDIKVWEQEQDLDALALKVQTIIKDGLVWKSEYKLVEVAFGIKKNCYWISR